MSDLGRSVAYRLPGPRALLPNPVDPAHNLVVRLPLGDVIFGERPGSVCCRRALGAGQLLPDRLNEELTAPARPHQPIDLGNELGWNDDVHAHGASTGMLRLNNGPLYQYDLAAFERLSGEDSKHQHVGQIDPETRGSREVEPPVCGAARRCQDRVERQAGDVAEDRDTG
jgi:hypothetical protein